MISFIIPAHNEEAYLPKTLDTLLAAIRQIGEPFEIIVVNDASTDRTRDVALERGVQVIDVQHRHIAATRNSGARAASGDILFFIDADTQANAAIIRAGRRALRQGAIAGGCVPVYDGPVPLWVRLAYPLAAIAARLLTQVGGAFVFCRRSDFEAIGGFCERYFAAEDLGFVRDMKRRGRFVVPSATVLTSNRKIDRIGFWRAMRLIARLAVGGPEAFVSRDGLDLWYGPEARS